MSDSDRHFVHIDKLIEIEKSEKKKLREDFSCGEKSLDDFLKNFARKNSKSNVGQTHLLIEKVTSKILGYYTLSNISFKKNPLLKIFRKFPAPEIPGTLIGRLAVSTTEHGKGCGERLLLNALEKILGLSKDAGLKIVVVDALNDRAKGFYQNYGFKEFEHDQKRLFVTIESVEKLFSH